MLGHAERLARTNVATADFYRQVLDELVEILEADGAAIWSVRDDDVSLLFDTTAETNSETASKAVETVIRVEPDLTVIVPPNVGGRLPNGTEFTRCVACLSVASALRLVLDVRLSVDAPSIENLADVVTAVASIVVEFHRGRQLARLLSLSNERDRIATLSRSLHGSLFRSRIALEVANDGATALRVDRISVLLSQHETFRLEAATSVGEINPRANASRAIEQFVEELRQLDQLVPWTAHGDDAAADQATQLARKYLTESGATRVRVEPLGLKPGSWNSAPAVAVFEMFGPEVPNSEVDSVTEVCRHAAIAFNNAVTFEAQGISGQLHRLRQAFRSNRARAVVWFTAALVILLVAIPVNFEIEAHGQVQPVRRRHVYAPEDGIISQVTAEHGKTVAADDVLAVLRNPELDLDEQRIRGEISTTNARLASVRAARVDNDKRSSTTTSSAQLTAEEEELKQAIGSLTQQLEILNRRSADLTLKSPIAGQVVRWDLIRSLETRPVRRGQMLMQVMDASGPWQLELRIPDRSVRHVLAAHNSTPDSLAVRFLFRMSPLANYSAKLSSVNLATDVDQEGELSTLATVSVRQSDIPNLRPGSSVIAKINCGRRSIGYVWLREFWEFVETHLLF